MEIETPARHQDRQTHIVVLTYWARLPATIVNAAENRRMKWVNFLKAIKFS
jgi:hypothetical protein